jgi:SHS2 domain-containing protein
MRSSIKTLWKNVVHTVFVKMFSTALERNLKSIFRPISTTIIHHNNGIPTHPSLVGEHKVKHKRRNLNGTVRVKLVVEIQPEELVQHRESNHSIIIEQILNFLSFSPSTDNYSPAFGESFLVNKKKKRNNRNGREKGMSSNTEQQLEVLSSSPDTNDVDIEKEKILTAPATPESDSGESNADDDHSEAASVRKDQVENNSANSEPALDVDVDVDADADGNDVDSAIMSQGKVLAEQENDLVDTELSHNVDLVKAEAEILIPRDSRASVAQSKSIQNQQALMLESGKLLETLRKEIYKLRGQNAQLRSDFQSLQGNNQRLMDANNSLASTFDSVNKHAKQVSKANAKLKQELQKSKDKLQTERIEHKAQIQAMTMVQMELKEEAKMKQGSYIAEVHSRLNYQKVLANIVDKVQGRCRDHRLVEEILAMSDECEL